jgi:hypothetical protein
MPAVNATGPGPETFGPGITWNSTFGESLFGFIFPVGSGYGFGSNGAWDGAIGAMAGLNTCCDSPPSTMTFGFATPVNAVGGFLNYSPDDNTTTTIAVYDSTSAVIESYDLTFQTGGGLNTGMFLGFQEPTADIAFFRLTDSFIGLTDLTISSVPEPAEVLPLALLLGILALTLKGKLFLADFNLMRRHLPSENKTS